MGGWGVGTEESLRNFRDAFETGSANCNVRDDVEVVPTAANRDGGETPPEPAGEDAFATS